MVSEAAVRPAEKVCSIETNSSSWVMPVMISGMTSGAFTMPVSSSRPGNLANRTSAMAASVPRITAPRRGDDADLERQPGGIEQLVVVQQLHDTRWWRIRPRR